MRKLISHECPLEILEESRAFNDYDYALVHLFETNEQYYNFFKESIELGRKVILDNSIFELGTAFDMDRFAYWINELQPTEYIIPDVLEDCSATIKNLYSFLEKYPDLPGKKIAVVQGHSYVDICNCYREFEKAGIDKIAISFDYSFFLKNIPHPNKWMGYTLGRVKLLTDLLNQGIISIDKEHHLLGCALPIEFFFYKDSMFDWIKTIDTSSPIVHGILDIQYEFTGITEKNSIKLIDLLEAKLTSKQKRIINYNVNMFKSYL